MLILKISIHEIRCATIYSEDAICSAQLGLSIDDIIQSINATRNGKQMCRIPYWGVWHTRTLNCFGALNYASWPSFSHSMRKYKYPVIQV